MAKQCEQEKCRSRHPKAVFLVDGRHFCYSCTEKFLETHGLDQHRVYRISDNDNDFQDETHCPTACGARA